MSLALVLVLAAAAPAHADEGSIAAGLDEVAFTASVSSCPESGACGWFAYATRGECDPASTALVWASEYSEGVGAVVDRTPVLMRGKTRICLWLKRNGSEPVPLATQDVGEASPMPVDHTEPIDGQPGRGLLIRVSLRGLPASVSADRFMDVVKRSAARWGITVRGTTRRRPALSRRFADGVSVIGFSWRVAPDTLGQESVFVDDGRLIDDDIALNARKPWQEGPAYPADTQVDLESVVLHELGHFTGEGEHSGECDDSPMVEAFGRGDWWRAPDDWNRATCAT